MSTEGWIFMVGFRVFDVGLLVAWLVWFYRLREDGGSDPPEEGGGGGGGGEGWNEVALHIWDSNMWFAPEFRIPTCSGRGRYL